MNDGYSICLNEWALDKDIKNELGLLLIISSLCAKEGYCYAGNGYLAKLFDIDEVSISRKLKRLEEKNYITIEYTKKQGYITERNIRLTKFALNKNVKCTLNKNVKRALNKNVKDNNININNINRINNNNLVKFREFKNDIYEKEDLDYLYFN